jgi:hypothetical protein
MLQLEPTNAEDKAGNAIVAIMLDDAFGEPDSIVDVTACLFREECALQQLAVFRIAAKRGAVIGCRGGGIALHSGMTRRQIVPGRRGARQFMQRRRPGEYLHLGLGVEWSWNG